MANHCTFCDKRRPATGTNHLILGDAWLEFCRPCGNTVKLTNQETGEQKTPIEIWNMDPNAPKLIWEDERATNQKEEKC